MLRQLTTLAALVLVACTSTVASAAIIYNGSVTDTSQIRSATNNPFFPDGQTDVVGVNFAQTGVPTSFVSGGSTLQGIASIT